MAQSRSKIVQRLTSARDDRTPVTVRRKGLEMDSTSGFVVAVLDNWVVLQDLSDFVYLDDAVLLRLDRVTSVRTHVNQAYLTRAVSGLGVPLIEFGCDPDATTGELLRIVEQRADLVGVYLETLKDYWLNIGKVRRIGSKRLDLHFIGRDGVWADFVERWELKNITRIEFGGRYIRALELFGEPMPAVTKRVKR